MASEDDSAPRREAAHEIGQDLSLLSEEELEARLALLAAESERLRAALSLKRATREAADRLFKS